jgi:hypothetical protein
MSDDDNSPSEKKEQSLAELMPPEALPLLTASGGAFVKQIGLDVIREVVFDVLVGKNLRDSTEVLTRRRTTALNLALVNLFLNGKSASEDFIELLPFLASDILSQPGQKKVEQWIARWMIGLTGKSWQNVLRDRAESLPQYRDAYIEACRDVVLNHREKNGELKGILETNSGQQIPVDWLFLTYLLNAVGSQTLTIRGSDKSAYGKLFEKLILGSLLHILGFRYSREEAVENADRVFWLSSRGGKRESDATLLYEVGKAVRFDIGFIGRGNTEISLDKVSRFEREIVVGSRRYYLATIILVDRIGPKSNIEQLARAIDGKIVQMSASYWPIQIARELNHTLGFQHELLEMDSARIEAFLKNALADVPLEVFMAKPPGRKPRKRT